MPVPLTAVAFEPRNLGAALEAADVPTPPRQTLTPAAVGSANLGASEVSSAVKLPAPSQLPTTAIGPWPQALTEKFVWPDPPAAQQSTGVELKGKGGKGSSKGSEGGSVNANIGAWDSYLSGLASAPPALSSGKSKGKGKNNADTAVNSSSRNAAPE